MKRVLIIGPFPDPITGVTLANKVVKEALDESPYFKSDFINTSFTEFDEKPGTFSLKKLFFYLIINVKIYKVFVNDVIYITPGQTFYGVLKYANFILASHLFKKRLVIHIHGNHLNNEYKLLRGFKKKIFHYLLSKANKGIVLSESLKDNMLPFIKSIDIYVLFNFAEDYLTSEDEKICVDELRILFLSNLMEEKGIIDLLDALKIIEDLKINYKAKIAGNIDKNNLSRIKSKLEPLKNTKYIGVVSGNNKKDLLDWANIFILPTYYKMEGQPISIIEAMATKNVIISTKHAGIPDIIKDGVNGYFVDVKSPIGISERLLYLDNNKKEFERIGLCNKNYFKDNFTILKFKSSIIKILNK